MLAAGSRQGLEVTVHAPSSLMRSAWGFQFLNLCPTYGVPKFIRTKSRGKVTTTRDEAPFCGLWLKVPIKFSSVDHTNEKV